MPTVSDLQKAYHRKEMKGASSQYEQMPHTVKVLSVVLEKKICPRRVEKSPEHE